MGSRVLSRMASVLAIVLLAATAACAQTPTQGYTPWEGQPGKDVVWVPTAGPVGDKMLDMAKVTPQDYLIDLGSGDGRLVIAAALRGARALGIEYNPDLVELSKRNAVTAGVTGRVHFVKADIFESDFSQASVITMFLLPDLNLRLRPQLLKLKPGTRVVSNTFAMDDWTPDETAEVAGNCGLYCTALLWIVPAQVDGAWTLPGGQLLLKQTFQMLGGTLVVDGKSLPIEGGRLSGERIAFTAGDAEYTGTVRGNEIEGEFKSPRGTGPWKAVRSVSR